MIRYSILLQYVIIVYDIIIYNIGLYYCMICNAGTDGLLAARGDECMRVCVYIYIYIERERDIQHIYIHR